MNIKLASHLALALLAAGVAIAAPASAQLRIDVSGKAGTNKTLWKFSGSSLFSHNSGVGNSTEIMDDDNIPDYEWKGPDWILADISNDDREFLPGSTVALTIGTRTETIGTLELDHKSSGLDEFAIGYEPLSTEWFMNHGDLISWAGQGEIDVDITEFILGSHNFSNYNDAGTLNMTMNISSVPEPGEWAAMGILGAGLAGLVIRKRRQA